MTKYKIEICWSQEEGIYIARVPDLPGCRAGGETTNEAIKNIEGAINKWIEEAVYLGNPVPSPRHEKHYL